MHDHTRADLLHPQRLRHALPLPAKTRALLQSTRHFNLKTTGIQFATLT